jgi:hypothetical protein
MGCRPGTRCSGPLRNFGRLGRTHVGRRCSNVRASESTGEADSRVGEEVADILRKVAALPSSRWRESRACWALPRTRSTRTSLWALRSDSAGIAESTSVMGSLGVPKGVDHDRLCGGRDLPCRAGGLQVRLQPCDPEPAPPGDRTLTDRCVRAGTSVGRGRSRHARDRALRLGAAPVWRVRLLELRRAARSRVRL